MKQTSQQGGEKGTRWKETTLGKLRILFKGQITRGMRKKSST